MAKRIAVAGSTPTWRRGVASILTDSGFTPVDLDGISQWAPGRGGVAVVFGAPDDGALAEVADFHQSYPHIPVLAVLPDLELSSFAAVVRSGAIGALGEDEVPDELASAVEAALRGRAVAPEAVLQMLAARIPPTPEPSAWVEPREAQWLQQMAQGMPVCDIAESAGYSEREMYRMLRELYLKVGATNRTEAIIWATRHGLLDEATPGGGAE